MQKHGCHYLHGQDPGEVPGPGGAASDGVAPAMETRWDVGVHLGGEGKGGGRFSDNGGVYSAKAEHSHTVHCYAIAYGPV